MSRPSLASVPRLNAPLRYALILFAVLLPASALLSVEEVDAGKLIQQSPRSAAPTIPPLLPAPEKPATNEAEANPAPSPSPKVFVRDILVIEEQNRIQANEFEPIIAPARQQELSFDDLTAYRDAVTAYLKAQGYLLGRAFLPRQDVTDGLIEIHVLLGQVSNDAPYQFSHDAEKPRTRSSVLSAIAENEIAPGEPLDEAALNATVLKMGDLAGVDVTARLTPGREPGETTIEYLVEEEPLHQLAAWVDNHGSKGVGAVQGTAQYSLVNPSGRGDQLDVMLQHSKGSDTRLASYRHPLTASGLLFGLSLLDMDYEVVSDLGQQEGLEGSAQSVSGSLSYPLRRTRMSNVYLRGALTGQWLEDLGNTGTLKDREKFSGSFDLSGDWLGSFYGGSFNSWSIGLASGNLDLSGAPIDNLVDSATYKTDGHFTKFVYQLSRLQRLRGPFTFFGSLSGQYAFDNLDSSEQFSLGGPNGIRGYPVTEAGGDRASMLNLELRYDVPEFTSIGSLQLKAFYDLGHVRLRHKTFNQPVPTLERENEYFLQGTGLGLQFFKSDHFLLEASWGMKIGDNPGRDLNGRDADGTDRDHRFWLRAVKWF